MDAEPYNGGVIVKFITNNSWFIGDVSVSGKSREPAQPRAAGQREHASELGQPFTESN